MIESLCVAVAYPKLTECILHGHLSVECSVVAVNIPNITGYIYFVAAVLGLLTTYLGRYGGSRTHE